MRQTPSPLWALVDQVISTDNVMMQDVKVPYIFMDTCICPGYSVWVWGPLTAVGNSVFLVYNGSIRAAHTYILVFFVFFFCSTRD
jgi:hypothetical protein